MPLSDNTLAVIPVCAISVGARARNHRNRLASPSTRTGSTVCNRVRHARERAPERLEYGLSEALRVKPGCSAMLPAPSVMEPTQEVPIHVVFT